jgi:predicted CoA-substrate-specific enzyme activase
MPHAVGIDVGSLYLKGVALDRDGGCLWQRKERHHGDVGALLERYLADAAGARVGITTRGGVLNGATAFDPVLCLTEGVRASAGHARNIIDVGGSSLTLVRLDEAGQVVSVHRNSLCAAGTGSFLDEQAARLNLDAEAVSGNPAANPPSIATRCAVFAKSDLIHRQQEGYSRDVLWSGLCRGLAEGVIRTLTCGQPLGGRTVLSGGVALNTSFVWWLEQALAAHGGGGHAASLEIAASPEFVVALGASLLAAAGGVQADRSAAPIVLAPATPAAAVAGRPPLVLARTRYPGPSAVSRTVDALGNEVTVHWKPAAAVSRTQVFLGVDIGSTSTKCVLVDDEGRILLDIYRRTEGDPIGATRRLLGAIIEADRAHGFGFHVRASATTGSGRKLVGTVIGADLVVNEISAHGAGAIHVDPAVDTIFEIGGQDAKYLGVQDGHVVDANMNYVCAAGTGSFVEALAAKLGYSLEEAGDAAMGIAPPYTSSRCTVFMEQDVVDLLRRGATRAEALGAVLYSVVENYLERVVGKRRVSRDRIVFQGATARNRGLVAAIENLLGVEVVVSPYCHVMGAYGAALLAREAIDGLPTRFRGLDLGDRAITLEEEACHLCSNDCRISRVSIEGVDERPAWGMLCGREESDGKMRVAPGYAAFRKRVRLATARGLASDTRPAAASRPRPRLLMPRTLTTYSFFQFWSAFFDELGADLVLGKATDQACLDLGKECSGAEVCLPLKAAHGHVAALLEQGGGEPVFLPHMIADEPVPGLSNTKFCPYVEAVPSLVRAAASARGLDASRILAPVVDLSAPDRANVDSLTGALAPVVHASHAEVERALGRARAARSAHQEQLLDLGRSALQRARESGEPAIVVIGRPYNTLDTALSLDLPQFIASCGVDVVPMDGLPFDPSLLGGEFQNMFWHYGQRILSALMQVARSENLYAVYLTNFSCGPDSFILSYAESIMGAKPMLVLELDEHGSSGGYQTRVEAFLDVVRASRRRSLPQVSTWTPPVRSEHDDRWTGRTLWLPPMHEYGARLLAAAIRSNGHDARVLPAEDDEAYALGKRMMRGNECLPAPLTLGAFLKQVERDRRAGRNPAEEAALFMPTACGPCRFGQYRTLQRLALDRAGLSGVPLVSPGSRDTYFELQPVSLVWESLVASDILLKMRCKVRPYEATAGDADQAIERWTARIEEHVAAGRVDWEAELGGAMRDMMKIPVRSERRPLVGIVGEIYIRANPYSNGHVIDSVEEMGGEAWLSPLSEWFEYVAWLEHYRARRAGRGPVGLVKSMLKRKWLDGRAHRLYRPVQALLHDRMEPPVKDVLREGARALPVEFEGESILTVGRAVHFQREGCRLVVNCAPFSCMHGNITSALFEQLRGEIRIPVVNVFYDGSSDNTELATFIRQASAAPVPTGRPASAAGDRATDAD